MTSLRTLRALRASAVGRLSRLPNVIGTGLGIKRRAGRVVSPLALIVYVSSKVPSQTLVPTERVPKFVSRRGERIPTDVVQINDVRPELGLPPYAVTDAATLGLISAFARDGSGNLFAVSCAHCLLGPDGNPHTTASIAVWDSDTERYEPAGESVYCVSAPGFGFAGDYGFSDAGLVLVGHGELAQLAGNAAPVRILDHPRRGMPVYAEAFTHVVTGTIDALEANTGPLRTDVVVRIDGRGTRRGYSGMLWRTDAGDAVGIHAYGAQIDADTGESRYSLAMSARRAARQLQVTFFETAR